MKSELEHETVRPELVEGEKYILQGVAGFHHGSIYGVMLLTPRTATYPVSILINYIYFDE